MTKQILNHRLYWTKDAFSLNHSIYDDGNLIGIIKDKSTNRSVQASIFGKKLVFETEGFFKPHINIFDLDNKKELGRIDFSIIRNRAKVRLLDNLFHWKFANFITGKWILSDDNDLIKISGENRKEGHCIVENNETPLLLLTSLVIRNHFMKQGGF